MPLVKSWSGVVNSAHSSFTVTVPTGGLAAGHLVVIGFASSTASLPGVAVEDSGTGNTWAIDRQIQEGASGSGHQVSSKLVNALPAGATITITFTGSSPARSAWSAHEFDDNITGKDTGAATTAGGVTGHPASANFSTSEPSVLIVGVINMISAGRIYTPHASYSGGTKVASTAGSGDRAVVVQWKYVSAGTYLVNGTFNSSALWSAMGQVYVIGAEEEPVVFAEKRWDGSQFREGGERVRWTGTQFKRSGTLRRWTGTEFIPAS